ncbi:protein anoxia up-regulated-like [Frankliniella occidentalis]|uniref:Protein anoxia up-regulated-like n=1 Tax=Frankliniella occidentalis TaxID=133901 RepID=A0A9C6XB59_FRAOC|nr:protein anoxia up-regulated-like [Frankliniella occidentalis]
MVYESDFYTTRRPYSRPSPSITSYSVTTPRHYVVTDRPDRARRADEQYSYSYSAEESTSRSDRPGAVPTRSYTSSSERVQRSAGSGPGSNYSSSTERTSRSSGDGPGGYHSSYSSTASGSLPGGTRYRHFSYRV